MLLNSGLGISRTIMRGPSANNELIIGAISTKLKALNTEFIIESYADLGDEITVSVELSFTVCDAIYFLKNVYPLFNDESFKLVLQTTVQEAEVTP